jgi:peptidoglycan/LPS O-acetylase OafA/YrhL
VSGIIAALVESKFKTPINTNVAFSSALALIVLFFINFNSAYGFLQAIILFLIFLCILKSKTPFFIFNNGGSQWLGKISYNIYMLHGLCLTIFFMLLQQQKIKLSHEYYWLYVFVLGLVVIAVSSITYLYIEKRFMLKNNVPT